MVDVPQMSTEDTEYPYIEEHSLILAVLERALCDLHNKENHIRRDARAWFRSNVIDPFSFVWCMQELQSEDRILLLRTKIQEIHYTKEQIYRKKSRRVN